MKSAQRGVLGEGVVINVPDAPKAALEVAVNHDHLPFRVDLADRVASED